MMKIRPKKLRLILITGCGRLVPVFVQTHLSEAQDKSSTTGFGQVKTMKEFV
jgi:hypothetical protein